MRLELRNKHNLFCHGLGRNHLTRGHGSCIGWIVFLFAFSFTQLVGKICFLSLNLSTDYAILHVCSSSLHCHEINR